MKHIIIGTAGHIDHGKTTLIRALTGRDTDTLKEEKERGISINLGFTYFDLPSGKRAGIVDVPGHERFIKNMLAGASGIDIVLLVVAADEGIMPQTREHMDILSFLDIKKGIIVVTKKDMVEQDWLDIVIEDVQEFAKGTFLEGSPVIALSSVTGEGLDELVKVIDRLSEEIMEKSSESHFRLPVDRVFTISGFGTVITGTLINGTVSEGDKIIIYPSGVETKVRNIQVHEQSVKSAFAGQRVAINLANIKLEDVKRGDILAHKGYLEPSMMLDCRLNFLKSAEKNIENRDRVRIYHGTSELLGRLVLLNRESVEPGDSCLAQIRLESPISALGGDRLVFRAYSPMVTIGGGIVIDPNPPKRKRFDKRTIDELERREQGDPKEIVEYILFKNSKSFPDFERLVKLSGRNEPEVREALDDLRSKNKLVEFSLGEGVSFAHSDYLNEIARILSEYLEIHHKNNPLKSGMPKEEIKSRIFEGNIKQKVFDEILSILEGQKFIKTQNKHISLYNFSIQLSPTQESIKGRLLQMYDTSGISGLKLDDALAAFTGETGDARMVLDLLMDIGELVKINEDMVILKSVYEESLSKLRGFFSTNKEITLAQYRDVLDTSRKCAVSLLEYFDQVKITKRIGDKRMLY